MKCIKCGNDNAAWGEEHCVLSPGDTLLLYTDGVIDALGVDEQPSGLERLLATARSYEEGTVMRRGCCVSRHRVSPAPALGLP